MMPIYMGIIEELKNDRIKKDTTLPKLVVSLYDSCMKMIKFKNKNGITTIIYNVPDIHPGFPLYDKETVALSFNKYLKKQGFKTIYTFPGKICISW